MSVTVKVSKFAMCHYLESYTGTSFASLRTMTDPPFLKKGRASGIPFAAKFNTAAENVKKFSSFTAGIGAYNYLRMIENRLKKEGKTLAEYEAGTSWHCAWGTSKTIRQHRDTGELYFYVYLIANNTPSVEYIDISTGKQIDVEELKEYLPVPSAPKNQGLEEGNEIQVRTLKLESLKELTFNGITYQLVA